MRPLALLLALLTTACAVADFHPRGETASAYAAAYPLYAEFCAVSQIKKKPGYGADIRGEIGGHAVFYLNGACLDRDAHYPVLRLCGQPGDEDGVGLSMNAHFRNAKFVAIPGRAFFFDGNLPPGTDLTRTRYQSVQNEAKRLGFYDGIQFHDDVFAAMPPGWDRRDWKYEVSVATDYAIALGRGRYCARIPVSRDEMARMVGFLNAQNAPYRAGATFYWNLFQDNCIHLAHNALAAAGLWPVWPTDRFLLWAILDFPVPKNEFVNLMRRTHTLPPDPGAAYDDPATRQALLADTLPPARPGALAEARPPLTPNEVYETRLKLIFYDDPMLGPYRGWFDAIFADPSYTGLAANRAWFAEQARRIEAARQPLATWLARRSYRDDPIRFAAVYDRYYRLMAALSPGT